MRRRDFGAVQCGSFVGLPVASQSQQLRRPYRIAYITATAAQPGDPLHEAFRTGLAKQGLHEGQVTVIEARFAAGNPALLPRLVEELIAWGPDVIVAPGTAAAVAAKRATSTIPIVFVLVADALSVGLIESIRRPGGNATGLTTNNIDLLVKRLELLRTFRPSASTIGFLFRPDDPSNLAGLRAVEGVSSELRLKFLNYGFVDPATLEVQFAKMEADRVEGLFVYSGLVRNDYKKIADLAQRAGLATVGGERNFPAAGGLSSYSTNFRDQMLRAAYYVEKIMNGALPSELPVEQPTAFEMVVNTTVAKALNIDIPVAVIVRADEVIE
jgi:putative tryptophan/tyrosine transport system substrate-binding protein